MFILAMMFGLDQQLCVAGKASLEQSIMEGLTAQMTVNEVNMTPDASCNFTGYAKGKTANGLSATRNCTATLVEHEFRWLCVPGIDQETLREVEDAIKSGLASKGKVRSITMRKGVDEDHMVGRASVIIAGRIVNGVCTAVRDPKTTGTSFDWTCK